MTRWRCPYCEGVTTQCYRCDAEPAGADRPCQKDLAGEELDRLGPAPTPTVGVTA